LTSKELRDNLNILSCDVSYSSFGLVLFSTDENKVLLNETYKFNSLSSINKKEQLLFKNIPYNKELCKDKKSYKELGEYWNNIRLHEFLKNINRVKTDYKIDVIVSEAQFSKISDVFAVVRIASVTDEYVSKFKLYYPNSWHKILFNNCKLERKEYKRITKEYVDIKVIPNLSEMVKFNSEDEYDAMALIMTYLIDNKFDTSFRTYYIDKGSK
jgi:hypothetical protein